uniref:ApaG domain-containing protein n=1 Tax=Loa loa TaxID=7209 RepID=A0A1I7W424_LOALO
NIEGDIRGQFPEQHNGLLVKCHNKSGQGKRFCWLCLFSDLIRLWTSFFLYSDTFPDIPLSTLRLPDESSMTGVHYQFRFHASPVYAIVGFRKFGGENPIMEDLFEEND